MKRADISMVDQGVAKSRTHAKKLIEAKKVYVLENGVEVLLEKPSVKVSDDTKFNLVLDESDCYVSRGALKLLGAIETFNLNLEGVTALDVGQSTGGFTDCLLQYGAKRVVGIDVGHDQLDESLKKDSRVICYEGINARQLPQQQLLDHTQDGFDVIVMDVSFISQKLILPELINLLNKSGCLVSLVKPQFEVGKENIGKGGIVRDRSLFSALENDIKAYCDSLGFEVIAYIDSPVKGGDGNREYLMLLKIKSRL